MAGDSTLAGENYIVAQRGAAGNSGLSDDDTASTHLNVVPDLNQIINPATVADDGVRPGAAVDCRIGADFDVVADDDTTELRDGNRPTAVGGKSEAIFANSNAGKQANPIAQDTVRE